MKPKTVTLDGSEIIDLDARKAARLELSGVKKIRFGGQVWEFKPELPMSMAEALNNGQVKLALSGLLVDPTQASAFLSAGDLTIDDMRELMEQVYGLDLGKL